MSNGIWVMATTKVIKKSSIKKGNIVLQEELQGPAVATGTTVTSPSSEENGAGTALRFPWMPEISNGIL